MVRHIFHSSRLPHIEWWQISIYKSGICNFIILLIIPRIAWKIYKTGMFRLEQGLSTWGSRRVSRGCEKFGNLHNIIKFNDNKLEIVYIIHFWLIEKFVRSGWGISYATNLIRYKISSTQRS